MTDVSGKSSGQDEFEDSAIASGSEMNTARPVHVTYSFKNKGKGISKRGLTKKDVEPLREISSNSPTMSSSPTILRKKSEYTHTSAMGYLNVMKWFYS